MSLTITTLHSPKRRGVVVRFPVQVSKNPVVAKEQLAQAPCMTPAGGDPWFQSCYVGEKQDATRGALIRRSNDGDMVDVRPTRAQILHWRLVANGEGPDR